MEWSGITEMDDTQLAYSTFYKLLAEKCASFFPFKESGVIIIYHG